MQLGGGELPINEENEPYNIDECQYPTENWQPLDYEKFRNAPTVFPDVKFIEKWAVYDGSPMCGICEIYGQQFFFNNLVGDTWHYYNRQSKETYKGFKYQLSKRGAAIAAVYDIKIDMAKEMNKDLIWEDFIGFVTENCNCIGVFVC